MAHNIRFTQSTMAIYLDKNSNDLIQLDIVFSKKETSEEYGSSLAFIQRYRCTGIFLGNYHNIEDFTSDFPEYCI